MRHPWIVCVFAVAMGILEAAVVVYLRRIYYPAGFDFPLVPFEPSLLRIEVIREASTIVMLGCVAILSAARGWSRIMAFLFAFAVWDIVYYAGLKIFLDWPASFLAPDILFLIPSPWVGPVLAPILVSAVWIAGSLALHKRRVRFGRIDLILVLASVAAILASFLLPSGTEAVPRFSWTLFGAGLLLGSIAFFRLAVTSRSV